MSGAHLVVTVTLLAAGLLVAGVWGAAALWLLTANGLPDTERTEAGCALVGFVLLALCCAAALLAVVQW